MEITPELRKLLRERREVNNLTLAQLKIKSGVSISTLSAIESGTLIKIKDATFQKVAKHLGLSGLDKGLRINDLRIGLGFSLWGSPIINSLVEDDDHFGKLDFKSLKFACFFRDKNGKAEPIWLEEYTKKPAVVNSKVYTANELVDALDADSFDIIFLPEEVSFYGKDIIRLGRVMNTVKAGVQLLVIKKERKGNDLNLEDEPLRNFLLQKQKKVAENECMFLYPKNSIAQHEINNLFDKTTHLKDEIVVADLGAFPEQIKKRCDIFFQENENAKCVVFAGWDILIFNLERKFKEHSTYKTITRDTYKFTDEHKPISKYSYDFVTRKEKLDFIKSSIGILELFKLIERNIKDLNSIKHSINNPRTNKLADFIDVNRTFAHERLMQTNFEFLLYPEFVDTLINKK